MNDSAESDKPPLPRLHRLAPRHDASPAEAERQTRRRGRPRGSVDPNASLDQWLDGLPAIAVHIAEVARSVLIDEGYEAVTIEHVALQANVDPATVRRHFVSKAGLVHAVWDRLEIEAWEELVERVANLEPPEERLHAYIAGLGALIADPLTGVGVAEVISHGVRDPVTREKLATDYQIARDGTLQIMGLESASADDRRRLQTLVSLIVAVIDGLALQMATEPESVDRDAAFELLADMVAAHLAE